MLLGIGKGSSTSTQAGKWSSNTHVYGTAIHTVTHVLCTCIYFFQYDVHVHVHVYIEFCSPAVNRRRVARFMSFAIYITFFYLFWKLGDPFPMLSAKHGEMCTVFVNNNACVHPN